MKFLSLFSGIEAASVAWAPLGWEAVAFSEVAPFPSAVLAHRFPGVPNLGDMTKVDWSAYRGKVDLMAGGPPCQAFSIDGLRKSMEDARGNLSLAYVRAIQSVSPRWCLTENVPGWLNTPDNAFGCFLAGLVGADAPLLPFDRGGAWPSAGVATGPRYGVAWRVLDAQYFGVPQRRRRVFVVGHLGDWRPAAEVLFESEGLRGNLAEGGEEGEEVAHCLRGRANSSHREDSDNFVAHTLKGEGFDASEDGTGRGVDLTNCRLVGDKSGTIEAAQSKGNRGQFVLEDMAAPPPEQIFDMRGNGDGKTWPTLTREAAGDRPSDYAPCVLAFDTTQVTSPQNRNNPKPGDPSHPLAAGAHPPAIAFTQNQSGDVLTGEKMPSMGTNQNATGRNTPKISAGMAVRRLTPRECERLQGFPDDWTLVPYRNKPAADGPRYKSIGNSWAVPCARWIGQRIQKAQPI